jgi:hypothetical protein
MQHRTRAVFFWLSAFLGPARGQSVDEIICRARNADMQNEIVRPLYAYTRFQTTREVDSTGQTTSSHSSLDEVRRLGGDIYLLPLGKDGKPLPPSEASRGREKFNRSLNDYESLSENERRLKLTKALRDRAEVGDAVSKAFRFTLAGEETFAGDATWKVDLTPKPDYQGKYPYLRNTRGTLWISRKDYQWVRIKAETVDTIWFGFLLARFGPGLQVTFENTNVDNEVWQPARIEYHNVSARFGLIKTFNGERDIVFSNYRKTTLKPVPIQIEKPCR